MPELPEVETIARSLRQSGRGEPGILGMTIEQVQIFWDRSIQTPSREEFVHRIIDQRVESIGRRGKYLLLTLSHDYLLIHLRMSGDIRIEPLKDADNQIIPQRKHDRVAIWFEEGYRLSFEDARKFGRMWLVSDPEEVLGNLGPEPLDPELTDHIFFQRLHAVKRQLKPLLLDQTFLAGLGNIYTDEALHQAHIHPLQSSNFISEEQAGHLLNSIRNVLQTGIKNNGASIDWVYRGGSFQNNFQVYGRENKTCYSCGHLIEKIIVGQRGTHFCPFCQRYNQSPE